MSLLKYNYGNKINTIININSHFDVTRCRNLYRMVKGEKKMCSIMLVKNNSMLVFKILYLDNARIF